MWPRRTERETQPPLQFLKDDNTGLKDKLSTLIETELSGYQSNPEQLIWFMKPFKQIANKYESNCRKLMVHYLKVGSPIRPHDLPEQKEVYCMV